MTRPPPPARDSRPALRRKVFLAFCIALNLGILAFFKYAGFLAANAVRILNLAARFTGAHALETPAFGFLLPVGISFYTFQALGYVLDVYRGTQPAERDFFRYALFVSFFPQLVAGPIERSGNLLAQMREPHRFDAARAVSGLTLMLWGYFEKVVVADRCAVLVNAVFNDNAWRDVRGFQIVTAVAFFAAQIYGDFAGYSHIASGAAEVLGFRLSRNFNCPYFALSIQDFWKRWHISLSAWLRDYLYIPLGGSRCSRLKKYRNILITFLASGLWHGASWHFAAWGLLHGVYQVAGDALRPARERVTRALGVNTAAFSFRLWRTAVTFALTCAAWVFFRAGSFLTALRIGRRVLAWNPWVLFDGSLYKLGLKEGEFRTALFSIAALLAVDVCHYAKPGFSFRAFIARQNLAFQYLVYIMAILFVLVFGVYGPEYAASNFIYFQF